MKLASASAAILALLGAAAVPAASALEGRRAITTGGRNAIAFPDQVAAAMEVFKDEDKKDDKSAKDKKDDKDKDGKDKEKDSKEKDDKDKDKDKDDKDKDKDKSSKDSKSKSSSSSSSSSSSKDDKKKKDSRTFEKDMCVDPTGEEEEICDALKETVCKEPIPPEHMVTCKDVGLGPPSSEDVAFEAKDEKKDSKNKDSKNKESKKTDDKKKESKKKDDKKNEDKKDKEDKKKDDKSSKDKSSKDSKSKSSSSSSSSSSKDGKKKKTSRIGFTEGMCDEPVSYHVALCDDLYDDICEDPSNDDKDFCEWLGFGSSADGEVADIEARRKNLRG